VASDWGLCVAEREAYERDGFFARHAVFSEPELKDLREAAELVVQRAEAHVADGREDDYAIDGNRYVEAGGSTIQYEHANAEQGTGSETIRVIEPFHHLHPSFDRLIDDARIVVPMRGIVGCEQVALWTDKINLKRPREGSGFRWHQDSPYWSHACDHVDQLPNVMLALDDADEDNGCFRVIRGSHAGRYLPGLGDGSRLGPLFTDPRSFDEADQVLAIVPAGSLIFFNPHTVHGSQPNRSGAPRRALVLTYQPGGNRMFKVPAIRNAGESLALGS
jgi:ectoine hydroxylase-related dioxygenase (phytanoyl-CoA dioxygenase family)